MILNISRGKSFQSCRTFAFNWDELRLYPWREADPLIIGEGYHFGSEIISNSADIHTAVKNTELRMRERYSKSLILPEEQADIERNIEWAKHAVAQWGVNYDKADFKILWPEVTGRIPIPGTEHHCWFCHRLLFPDVPYTECPLSDHPASKCWQPHYFIFKTDGVIEMHHNIWLLEQKTTSSTDRSNFWTKFQLDTQVRGYAYGIWKATGVMINGVLINAIIKHNKQITVNGRKKYQLDPTNVGFEREPILLTKADLLDFEREFVQIANDYELAFRTGNIYKNTQSCFNYNRKCMYFDQCKRGDGVVHPEEFKVREQDYAEKAYYDLLGIPNPKENTDESTELQGQHIAVGNGDDERGGNQ
jgi:hypothetical protein